MVQWNLNMRASLLSSRRPLKIDWDGISFPFNLNDILQQHTDLSCLEAPFTNEEIDKVIQELPLNRSPGPDGFNSGFIQACWI